MSKIAKIGIVGLTAGGLMLAGAAVPMLASAATTTNLGDLLVLNQVFNGSNGSTGTVLNSGNASLGDLFVLDRLFATNSTGSVFSNTSNVISGGSTTTSNLGDLFILDKLFGSNSGTILNNSNGTNLGDLFVLNQLFSK